MALSNGSNVVDLTLFTEDGEWEIWDTLVFTDKQFFEDEPGIPYDTVYFRIYLRRKALFYQMNIVLPCIVMSVLDIFLFVLPPDSGEKISLGVTVVLTYSVFLLLVADNIPQTSDTVPVIGKLYFTSFLFHILFSFLYFYRAYLERIVDLSLKFICTEIII